MKNILKLGTLALTLTAFAMPMTIQAQHKIDRDIARRDQTRDEWKNIATVSGAVAILGLLSKDNTLTFAGGAGALYSLYRYDQDSKSKDRLARARAEYFRHDHFYRDGVRYNRVTVTKNKTKYYQFVKAPKGQQDWHGNRGHNDHHGKPKHHG